MPVREGIYGLLAEVNTPGEFITVGPTLTLSQAIARAGGTINKVLRHHVEAVVVSRVELGVRRF